MRKVLLAVVLSINTVCVFAQGSGYESMTHNSAQRSIQSPEVASMERYGVYPVNEATGIPDISIPVYTIRAGELEYPITLSYHMGGIRVDDVASCVGLGWTLMAGGYISRTVRGIADESPRGFLAKEKVKLFRHDNSSVVEQAYNAPLTSVEYGEVLDMGITGVNKWGRVIQYMQDMIWGRADSQSDWYDYQVHSVSGSFVYNTDRDLVQCPRTNHKILRDAGNSFRIVSDAGMEYLFSRSDAEIYEPQAPPPHPHLEAYQEAFEPYISSWMVSKIYSRNKRDSIEFSYVNAGWDKQEMQDGWVYSDGNWPRCDHPDMSETFRDLQRVPHFYNKKEILIQRIRFKNGSMEFNYSNQRGDNRRKYFLQDITVKDAQGLRIKKISFEYGYFGDSHAKRLKLNAIKIYGNGSASQNYSFEYNNTLLPSYYTGYNDGEAALYGNKGQDYWGFYNGVSTNKTLLGMLPANAPSTNRADREPRENFMKACILEKIIYPTGGYTLFETEANRITGSNGIKIMGGLRIKTITSFSGTGNQPATVISYRYEDGRALLPPDETQYRCQMAESAGFAYAHYTILGVEGVSFAGGNVFSEYYFENPINPLGYYGGSPVVYGKVTRYEGESGTDAVNGKTVFRFSPPSVYTVDLMRWGPVTGTSPYWGSVLPWTFCKAGEERYRRVQGGELRKTEEIIYGHNYTVEWVSVGVGAGNKFHFRNCPGLVKLLSNEDNAKRYFYYHNVSAWTGVLCMDYKRTVTFPNAQDTVSVTETYVYNNKNQVIEKSFRNSRDETVKTTYKYPSDFGGVAPYNTMIGNNILAPIVEQTEYVGSIQTRRERYDYAQWYNPPSGFQIQNGDNPPETRETYLYDTKGNIREIVRDGTEKTVYLWGYNFQYPVARIRGVTYDDIMGIGSSIGMAFNGNAVPTDYAFAYLRDVLGGIFPHAQVTTYTWQPLVGMTSETDPSGRTVFYEYDGFGRLKCVKDHNGKVMEQYDYHYKP